MCNSHKNWVTIDKLVGHYSIVLSSCHIHVGKDRVQSTWKSASSTKNVQPDYTLWYLDDSSKWMARVFWSLTLNIECTFQSDPIMKEWCWIWENKALSVLHSESYQWLWIRLIHTFGYFLLSRPNSITYHKQTHVFEWCVHYKHMSPRQLI